MAMVMMVLAFNVDDCDSWWSQLQVTCLHIGSMFWSSERELKKLFLIKVGSTFFMIYHCSQVPWGPNFEWDGDLMGTIASTNGDPKNDFLKIVAALTFSAFLSLKWRKWGPWKKWGPFGDPKYEKGPHGNLGPTWEQWFTLLKIYTCLVYTCAPCKIHT